jgi:hypothetical protein
MFLPSRRKRLPAGWLPNRAAAACSCTALGRASRWCCCTALVNPMWDGIP